MTVRPLPLDVPYWQDRPQAWHDTLGLPSFHDNLVTAGLRRARLITVLDPSDRELSRGELSFVVFAQYKYPYGVLEEVAAALSMVSLETGIMPLIEPFPIGRAKHLSPTLRRAARILRSSQVFPRRITT